MALTIYQREKLPPPDRGWRYRRIEEGRGKKTGDLCGPFYARPTATVDGKNKQVWKLLAGDTFVEAKKDAERLEAALAAAAKGLTVAEAEEALNANRIPIKTAVETYLTQKKPRLKPSSLAQYRVTFDGFLESLNKIRFLDEIDENALRRYRDFMAKKLSGKTIDTRLNILYFLLKKNGIKVRLPKDEMPVVEEEPAVPYTAEELKKLFAAMDDEEKIRYKFFLGTGCRDKEVTYAAWSDIDFDSRTYHIRRKEDVGFTPKSHESRTVPLPTSLIELLKARRKKAPHDRWIFVNEEGRPDNHFLRKLKRIALHAGLNCGQCRTTVTKGKYDRKHEVEVSCKTDPVCEHIYLHRFRKTCATRWHESSIPIRTIQAWLGHKSLETTMLYLGVTSTETLRTQIDEAFGD